MPPAGFTSQGPGGGPFSVTSQTYTLTNIGSTPLNWSLANSASWLTVSKNSGTLAPGAATTVTVGLNSAANSFLIANVSGNVTFADVTAGTFQNRQFDLYVGNGGFEAGDFTYWKLVGDTNETITLAADDVAVAGTNALLGHPDELFVHSGLYGGYLGQTNGYAPLTNGDALLSHTVATTAGQQYVLSFWLTRVTLGSNSNNFATKWNGSTLYNQTNLPGFAWTNLQFVVAARGVTSTLEFDCYDDAGAFGLDDVTVTTVPAPSIQSVGLSGTNVLLAWPTSAAAFQLQSSTNLASTNWPTITPPLTTNGGVISTLVPRMANQQFFRLKQ